jgi:ionotropic glutamate receptor
VPPETLYTKPPNRSSLSQELESVIWPGQTKQKPRGWVFPENGRQLRIAVPNHVIYHELVSVKGADSFSGYCIDVFTAALSSLPYAVPYKLHAFGNGINKPKISELLQLIEAGVSIKRKKEKIYSFNLTEKAAIFLSEPLSILFYLGL